MQLGAKKKRKTMKISMSTHRITDGRTERLINVEPAPLLVFGLDHVQFALPVFAFE
jgi:hypothetical protein